MIRVVYIAPHMASRQVSIQEIEKRLNELDKEKVTFLHFVAMPDGRLLIIYRDK